MRKEIHPAVMWGVIAVLVIGVIAFAFVSSSTNVKQVDVKSIPPERLLDPDPRSSSN